VDVCEFENQRMGWASGNLEVRDHKLGKKTC